MNEAFEQWWAGTGFFLASQSKCEVEDIHDVAKEAWGACLTDTKARSDPESLDNRTAKFLDENLPLSSILNMNEAFEQWWAALPTATGASFSAFKEPIKDVWATSWHGILKSFNNKWWVRKYATNMRKLAGKLYPQLKELAQEAWSDAQWTRAWDDYVAYTASKTCSD
jgi:hypothetical protein